MSVMLAENTGCMCNSACTVIWTAALVNEKSQTLTPPHKASKLNKSHKSDQSTFGVICRKQATYLPRAISVCYQLSLKSPASFISKTGRSQKFRQWGGSRQIGVTERLLKTAVFDRSHDVLFRFEDCYSRPILRFCVVPFARYGTIYRVGQKK